ncbi:MAG: hypothetical protein AB7N76_27365 [Planctomycetota bacterium]
MTLSLQLEARSQRLAVAESTTLALRIRNEGEAPAAAPQPPYSPEWPVFEVEGPEGQASFVPRERWAARRLRRFDAPGELRKLDPRCAHEVELAPGEELACEFELLHALELGPPGRYRVRASLPEAQSAWLELEVVPLAPERVSHGHLDSGHTISHRLCWTQGGQVQVCALHFGGQLSDAFSRPLAPGHPNAAPVSSAGPRGQGARTPRVLWLEGERLRGVGVDHPVPGARALLASPWQDPEAARTTALVACAPQDGWTPLVELELAGAGEAAEVRELARLELPWSEPRWSWAPWTQRGRWLLGACAEQGPDGPRLTLACAPWPWPWFWVGGDPGTARRGPLDAWCLTAWPLDFVAVDAIADGADRLRGAVLGWATDEAGARTLSVASWTLDADGAFRRDEPRPWPAQAPAEVEAVLRVDVLGAAHALTRAGDGPWTYARDGGEARALPELGPARPELLFAPGGERPLALGFDRRDGLVGVPIGYSLRDPASPLFNQPALT